MKNFYKRYKTLLNYSSASIFLNIVQMMASFAVLRWVDPKEYGVWQSLLIIQSYTVLIQMGVVSGLNRQLPYFMGKKNEEKIKFLAGSAQSIILIASGIFVLCAIISLFAIEDRIIAWSISMMFGCSAFAVCRNFLGSTYRAGRAFDTLAKINVVEGGVGILTLPLVFYFGYMGLVGRIVLLKGAGLLLAYIYRPLKVNCCFKWSSILSLMKVGIPIFAFSYMFGIANTFPKIILFKASGTELVGLFSPAIALTTFYNLLPAALARYIYPNMSYRLGKTDDPMSIWPMAWKSAIGTLLSGIICFVVGSILIGPFIHYCLPKYQEAIPAMYWCLGAGVFLGPRISINALFSLKAWKLLSIYTAVFLFSLWIFPWLGIRYVEDPLVGVGAGIFLSYLVIFLCAIPCIYFATHKKR